MPHAEAVGQLNARNKQNQCLEAFIGAVIPLATPVFLVTAPIKNRSIPIFRAHGYKAVATQNARPFGLLIVRIKSLPRRRFRVVMQPARLVGQTNVRSRQHQ